MVSSKVRHQSRLPEAVNGNYKRRRYINELIPRVNEKIAASEGLPMRTGLPKSLPAQNAHAAGPQ
jgi:hypothetical protein